MVGIEYVSAAQCQSGDCGTRSVSWTESSTWFIILRITRLSYTTIVKKYVRTIVVYTVYMCVCCMVENVFDARRIRPTRNLPPIRFTFDSIDTKNWRRIRAYPILTQFLDTGIWSVGYSRVYCYWMRSWRYGIRNQTHIKIKVGKKLPMKLFVPFSCIIVVEVEKAVIRRMSRWHQQKRCRI